MDLHKMIVELESERDRLNQAIFALERLSAGKGKKRGRPPKWLKPDRSDSNNLLPAEPVTSDLQDA